MKTNRRRFILGASAMLVGVAWTPMRMPNKEGKQMYGLIGKLTAVAGQRDALVAILLAVSGPGD